MAAIFVRAPQRLRFGADCSRVSEMSFFSRFSSSEVIEIESGRAVSVKGKHPAGMLGDVEDVCREFGVTRGKITLAGNGKLGFSKQFPEASHQAPRNVIVSQI